MRLLLLNNNPAVSRLIKLSAEKVGYELDEFEDFGLVPLATYDVLLIDNELYDEAALVGLSEQTQYDYVIYICQRGSTKPDAADVALEKPFLPTDFLVLLDKVKSIIGSHKTEENNQHKPLLGTVDVEEALNHSFDIDQIDDNFEIEDDVLSLSTFEETKEDLDDETSDEINFEELKLDDLDLDNESLSEDVMQEESLNLSLDDHIEDKEDLKDEELEDEEETPSFLDDDMHEDENINPSVLDKDDIEEVKQLLDENEEILPDEDEEIANISSFEEDHENDMLDEDKEEKQEEIIDDFTDTIDAKIEQERELGLEEELLVPQVDIVMHSSNESLTITSLDDLNENLIKKAFGEDVEDELESNAFVVLPKSEENEEVAVIRDEIESSISRSLSELVQSDILREALKGMKINISISFDDNK